MSVPLVAELEARRARLFERLAAVGDLRRGSVSENWRRCGKPSCRRCAEPGSRGHGPRWLWTRTVPGRGTIGRQLKPEEVEKVRGELENYQRFAALAGEIAEVSEAICEARPVAAGGGQAPEPQGQKKGLCGQVAGQLAAEAAAEAGRLSALAAEALAGGPGLQAAELAVRAAVLELGRVVLEPLLAADAGYAGPRTECGSGHQAGFVSYRNKTIDTVLGPVTLRRAWYHCAVCGHGFAPRDSELGVVGQTMSPGLARMTDRAAAALPFRTAAKLAGELAGVALTGERARRRAEADGTAAARAIEAEAAAVTARTVVALPPPGALPDMLYICVDGTGVPMTPAETAGRAGKGEDGTATTREVKLCCCFTQTTTDGKGRPVRDPHSSSYLVTFAPAAEFGVLMAAEARHRGAGRIRQLVFLGDGAAWIWNLATRHFPQATQIVDLYHAREHVHELARLLEFMLGEHKTQWLARRLDDLDDGDIPAICAAARVFPLASKKARDLDTALGYFEHNAHRMRYAHFKKLGMFIGSGAVEAGCKSIVAQRCKLSGMRWTTPGATGILTLRCLEASDRWQQIPAHPSQASAA